MTDSNCACRRSDAWKCAVLRQLSSIACPCSCHRPQPPQRVVQCEFLLRDWRPMASAPRNATWIHVQLPDRSIIRAHWAEDLSGSDQPPFRGWFMEKADQVWSTMHQEFVPRPYFAGVHPSPIRWRPE